MALLTMATAVTILTLDAEAVWLGLTEVGFSIELQPPSRMVVASIAYGCR